MYRYKSRHSTAVHIFSICSVSREEGKDRQEVVCPQVYKSDKYKYNTLPTTMGHGKGEGVTEVAEGALTCTWQLKSTSCRFMLMCQTAFQSSLPPGQPGI